MAAQDEKSTVASSGTDDLIETPTELEKAISITIVDNSNDLPLIKLRREASEPTNIHNDKLNLDFEVRPCRAEDSEKLDEIMRIPWPHQPEFRNPKYWTKEFIKPASKSFGFVIESKKGKEIVGFAMYRWHAPAYYEDNPNGYWNWWIEDFGIWRYDINFNKKEYEKKRNKLIFRNHNLIENWHKLSTHLVHFTDVSIHPKYRKKGLGTQLIQNTPFHQHTIIVITQIYYIVP